MMCLIRTKQYSIPSVKITRYSSIEGSNKLFPIVGVPHYSSGYVIFISHTCFQIVTNYCINLMKAAVFRYNIKLEGVEPMLPNGRDNLCVSKMNENFGVEGERDIHMTCLFWLELSESRGRVSPLVVCSLRCWKMKGASLWACVSGHRCESTVLRARHLNLRSDSPTY